jgi:hypothetical protein
MTDTGDLPRRSGSLEAGKMREYRAWLLGEVARGSFELQALFEQQDVNRYCGTVEVVVLAEKVPGVGKVRARRAMEALGIGQCGGLDANASLSYMTPPRAGPRSAKAWARSRRSVSVSSGVADRANAGRVGVGPTASLRSGAWSEVMVDCRGRAGRDATCRKDWA